MQIVNKVLHFVVSVMQTFMEHFWVYEKRYLKKHCANAIKASPDSPPRADEPFDMRIIDVVGDTQKIGDNKSFVNLLHQYLYHKC